VLFDTACTNQKGEKVLAGVATVIAPDRKIEWSKTKLPDVSLRRHERYDEFIKDARSRPPMAAAIVHPCLAEQLIYFAEATAAGLALGARVPIVLTSRADSLSTRLASAALAKLLMAPHPIKGFP
jgi:hypothetical protein